MDATQQIDDSFCDDDTDEEKEQEGGKKDRQPLATLKVFKNNYIPETEVPLYQGENVLGRDPASCAVPLQARSISSRHAVISISMFRDAAEALLWDLGSLNGTRKGRIKLTPHVRYALTEGDSVVLADLPCQYISQYKSTERTAGTDSAKEKEKGPMPTKSGLEGGMGRGVENGGKRSELPPVPLWGDKEAHLQSPQKTPKQPERTLVPESDSDSEGEAGGRRERRKFLASDSASSDLSSPACSTFLTPANKIIPESEDESSITPSSEVMGRFTKKENLGEASSDSLKPALLNFNMDSDTEGEEEEAEARKREPEVKAPNPPQVDPPCLHMDSDTDVEDEVTEKTKSPEISTVVPHKEPVAPAGQPVDSDTDVEDEATEKTKSPEISAVVPQKEPVAPAGLTLDSDTDVEENEPGTAEPSLPSAGKEQKTSAEFHMESDTDAEDEDVPAVTKLESPVSVPPANPGAELYMDSDTDAEDQEKPAEDQEKPTEDQEKPTEAIKLISDSDTDDDDPFKPTKSETVENAKAPKTTMLQPDSDSDTDMEDDLTAASSKPHKDTGTALDAHRASPAQVQPPAEKAEGEFRMDSDTDVEEGEEETLEGRELKGSGIVAGIIQSSTPRGAGLSEEEMETQAFVSPSQPFKRPALPSLLQSSPGGHSQDSDDFTVAETQSFVSGALASDATLDETQGSLRGCEASPIQLGLSDSGHQQPGPEDPAEDDWALQPTQPYAMKNLVGRGASAEAGQKQLDLEATQAFAVDMDKEEEEEEEQTQPMKKGNSDTHGVPIICERGGRVVDDDGEIVDSHPSTADTLILVRSPKLEEQTQPYALFTAQTLPLGEEDDEEEEEFGSGTGPSGGLYKGRQTDEEQTQPMEAGANIHVAIAETLPMLEDEEEQEEELSTGAGGGHVADVEGLQPVEPDTSTRDAIAATQPMCEDEEEREEEQDEVISSRRPRRGRVVARVEETQPLESDTSTNVAIAETQPMGEDEEEREEDVSELASGRRSRRNRKVAKVEETQPLESDASTNVAIAETQPMGEDEEEREEEQDEVISSRRPRRGRMIARVEETQPLESDASTNVAIAETQPMGEDEEEREEEQDEVISSRRPRRGRLVAKVEETQPLEPVASTHVANAETTQAVGKDEEEREEERDTETSSSKRPRRGRKVAKAEAEQLPELHADTHVAETQPVGEDEEAQEEEQQGGPRRPRRGRKVAKVEGTQPLEPDTSARVANAEAKPVGEEEEAQEEEQQGEPRRPRRGRRPTKAEPTQPLKPDAGTHDTTTTTEAPVDEEEEAQEEEQQASRRSLRGKGKGVSGKGKGRAAAEKEGKRKRGRGVVSEEEEDSEEEAGGARKGRGRKSMRQKSKEQDERDRLKLEEEEEEKERVRIEREEREQKEQEEKDRLERERVERAERLEQERKENEERQRLKKEEEERRRKEQEENERRERERKEEEARLEQERKEREERERLEKEERERLEKEERERKEKEERERLEKEKKEREEKEKRERDEKERLERERKEREEKERLEKEAKEKAKREKKEKEQLEKEKKKKEKEDVDREEKETGRLQGKRRGGRLRKEKTEDEEDDESGQSSNSKRTKLEKENETAGTEKQEREDGKGEKKTQEKAESEAKPVRGRRPTRKSTAPPTGAEESASTDVPAKRTRSRSNSSNSVSSERSASTLDDQSKGRGRGRGRGRKLADEVADNSRQPGRRKTATAASTEMAPDPGACVRSRSNSGSSERSSSSAPQDKGGKGRKSVKVGKQDEGSQGSVAAGRGRGRGGKRLEASDVKAEATEEAQQEKEKSDTSSVGEDSVISQTPSRGRKRGADTKVLAAETPQPTVKTPRRSLAGQTHKVLFTGVVDEDGEKVLMRLGGGLAKGVGDMTHLVTDKVRRTVKFLCAVARGVPIVTLDWLTKCGKAGTFLSPNEFLVKDVEQEKKFNFNLQDSLRAASREPLLQGYEIHVTPSVKPEPSQMKDIITCCGARYLPKMPTAHKAQMVVVSCEEDRALCNKALSLAVPVVSAEFLLTGILQQKADLKTHALSASPSAASRPATQGRRK